MEPAAKATGRLGRRVRHDQVPASAVKERTTPGENRPSSPVFGAALYLLTVSRDHCPWGRQRALDEYISIDLPATRTHRFAAPPEESRHPSTATSTKVLPLRMIKAIEVVQPGAMLPMVSQLMEERLLELPLPIKAASAVVEREEGAVPEVDAAVFRDAGHGRLTQTE